MEAAEIFTSALPATPSLWFPDSPSRDPAWRWLRARRLFETGEQPRPGVDDRWVLRARNFLAARLGAEAKPVSRGTADRLDPAILGAVAMASEPESHRCALLEAALLTEEPLVQVARRCELPADVAETFNHLFFAVRDRPGARDWIRIHAVGSGPWNDFAGAQPWGLWKFAAFTGGWRVLDVVIAITMDSPLPEWLRASWTGDPQEQERRFRLHAKLTLAVMTARSPIEQERLIALRNKLLKLDAREGRGTTKRTTRLDLMATFLSNVASGRPSRRKPAGKSSAERARGRRAACGGQRRPSMLEELFNL